MKNAKIILSLAIIITSSFLLSACGKKVGNAGEDVTFSAEDTTTEEIGAYGDKYADAKIVFTQSYDLNKEFKVKYKTAEPTGEGTAEFKVKSIKEITSAGEKTPDEGKKLYLVEIAVRGNTGNKGQPSTFNQIGDTPSPQFVLVNKDKNITDTETTYYSDGYTEANKLFELSKITMDHDQWVSTAIVFQVDKDIQPDLAFRFINIDGNAEFYDIK